MPSSELSQEGGVGGGGGGSMALSLLPSAACYYFNEGHRPAVKSSEHIEIGVSRLSLMPSALPMVTEKNNNQPCISTSWKSHSPLTCLLFFFSPLYVTVRNTNTRIYDDKYSQWTPRASAFFSCSSDPWALSLRFSHFVSKKGEKVREEEDHRIYCIKCAGEGWALRQHRAAGVVPIIVITSSSFIARHSPRLQRAF